MSLHEKIFLASGLWTCPAGVKRIEVEGCGGGGGGGGGFYTTNSTNLWLSGGSGGGGAKLGICTVSVTPGTSYTAGIGAGGAGGAGTLTGLVKATDGSDGYFMITAGATLATFSGAGAGYAGGGTTSSTSFVYHIGGQSTKFGSEQDPYSVSWSLETSGTVSLVRPDNRPHQGGFTVGTNDTSYGVASYGGPSDLVFGAAASFRGGAPSTDGTDSSTYRGGSSGGGGGAGAYGPGGQAANGGNANGSGQGANGGVSQASVAGGANTGAGGGGGGAPGCGSSNVGVASAGAAGGSGKIVLRWTT